MFCINCGNKLEDTDKFCCRCGYKVMVKNHVANKEVNSIEKQAVTSNSFVSMQENDYEDDYDNEYETTLLSENSVSDDRGVDSQIHNDEYEEDYDDEYDSEYETTLLSEEEYNETTLLTEEDGYNETTLLSIDSGSNRRGADSRNKIIPDSAPKAVLMNIINQESNIIRKSPFIVGSERYVTDLYVPNPTVSRQHAYIIYVDDEYYIMDNYSTNKTTLDGIEIEPNKRIKLYNGALVQLSDELFQFCILKQ